MFGTGLISRFTSLARRAAGTARLPQIEASIADAAEQLRGLRADLAQERSLALRNPTARAGEIVERDGLYFLLDRVSVVDRTILEGGDWERDQRNHLFETAVSLGLRNDAVFLDIGAYFGLYSLYALKSGLFKELHAFEPDRLNRSQLYAIHFLNRITHEIAVHDFYVSDAPGTVEMTHSGAMGGNRGGAGRYGEGINQALVPANTIDAALGLEGRDIVSKIDAEDGEFSVLGGMTQTIAKNRVLLQVESSRFDRLKETCASMGLRYLDSLDDHYFTNVG